MRNSIYKNREESAGRKGRPSAGMRARYRCQPPHRRAHSGPQQRPSQLREPVAPVTLSPTAAHGRAAGSAASVAAAASPGEAGCVPANRATTAVTGHWPSRSLLCRGKNFSDLRFKTGISSPVAEGCIFPLGGELALLMSKPFGLA